MPGRVETVGGGVVFAGDGGLRQLRQRVADELGIDAASAVEAFFEGEDDHHAGDALLHPAKAAALPGPELRADEVDDRGAEFFQLAGKPEIDVGEVDEDGDVGPPLPDGSHEAAIGSVDARHVADDLGDAHVGDVFGPHDAIEACVLHLPAAKAETGELGRTPAKLGDELRAVVVSAGFAGR